MTLHNVGVGSLKERREEGVYRVCHDFFHNFWKLFLKLFLTKNFILTWYDSQRLERLIRKYSEFE
jgi:hypothetical protein